MAVTAQGRGRTGGRQEPRGGWRLDVKTSVPPESGPAEELTPEESARQEAADGLEAKRRSDRMARQDVSDLGLDEHHVPAGRSAFKTRGGGTEPRTPFGGDPAEERRIAGRAVQGESPSVWAQDTRAPHYRESWDEQQAARLANEGEAAEHELRKAVAGGLGELVRVRTVVLADRLTPSAAELERLERRPRLDDDGRRANRRDRAQVVADGLPLAPPLGASLVHAEVDPALVALAAGKYPGAVLEPAAKPEWLAGPGRAEAAAESLDVIERALDDVEAACMDRWRDDPARAAELERRWERERDLLWDRASGCSAPEETRLLVEGMREYGAEMAETGRGVSYVVRLHTAVGRDPDSSPLAADALDAALDRYPDVIEGIRAVDPDSPLCVAPPGAGEAYGRLVAGALDAARAPVGAAAREGAPLDAGVVRARVLADVARGVEALDRGPQRASDERGGPSPADLAASAREREQRLVLERAEERFRDLSAALKQHGVDFVVGGDPGALRESASGFAVELPDDAFGMVSERGRDGEWFKGPVPVGSLDAQRAAVADAMCGAADALWSSDRDVTPPGASERFGARIAARVFDEPLPVVESVSAEAEKAAVWLASEVGGDALKLAEQRDRRIEVRDAAVERLGKVLEAVAVDDTVKVSLRDFMADDDGWVGYAVRRDPASGKVSGEVVIDPRLLPGDRSLTNDQLAEGHGQAYVDLGRALGEGDSDRNADWSKVYGVLASGGKDGAPVRVGVHSCASNTREHVALGEAKAYAAALREQVRADGFATEQMKRTWPRAWREATPRVVERVDRTVRVAEGRVSELGPPSRVGQVLARDGKRLAEDIGRSVGAAEKMVRRAARGPAVSGVADSPPCPPSPAAGAAEAQARLRGPRTEQDVLDAKLSVGR